MLDAWANRVIGSIKINFSGSIRMAKVDRSKLVRKISNMIAAELDASIFTSSGRGTGYNCSGAAFGCPNTYNCTEVHSCADTYTNKVVARSGFKGPKISVNKDISKQISKLIEKDVGNLIAPIFAASGDCSDATSFTCEKHGCGELSFTCANDFTGFKR